MQKTTEPTLIRQNVRLVKTALSRTSADKEIFAACAI